MFDNIGFLEERKLFDSLKQVININDYERLKQNLKRYMDDGFIPRPKTISADTFLDILNSLHPAINFTLETAVVTTEESGATV